MIGTFWHYPKRIMFRKSLIGDHMQTWGISGLGIIFFYPNFLLHASLQVINAIFITGH